MKQLRRSISVETYLGGGTYGKVYLVEENCLPQAIKYHAAKLCCDQHSYRREIKVMSRLNKSDNSPFVLKMVDYGLIKNDVVILLEYCARGSLLDYIKFKKNKDIRLREEFAYICMLELAEGIDHLHLNGIVHFDLKPDNVLIGDDEHFKICDLGLARYERDMVFHENRISKFQNPIDRSGARTHHYPAECYTDEVLTNAVDWYGLGFIVHCTMYYTIPPPPGSSFDKFKSAFNSRSSITFVLKDLLYGLLRDDPLTRLCCGEDGIDELYNHRHITSMLSHLTSTSSITSWRNLVKGKNIISVFMDPKN